jgi:chromosome segregation ATPase
VERAAILEVDDESGRDRIIEDSARLLRILETVLVLHEDRSSRRKDLEKMKEEYVKLEAENMKLENEVVDLRGEKENFVAAAKENRELKDEVAKFDEERKKFEEEIKMLNSAMAPAKDETENTRELLSRADFVSRVRKLGMRVFREVIDGQIVLPEKCKEAEAAELGGDDNMDDDVEEEEDDGTSKKTITPEDDA